MRAPWILRRIGCLLSGHFFPDHRAFYTLWAAGMPETPRCIHCGARDPKLDAAIRQAFPRADAKAIRSIVLQPATLFPPADKETT